MLLSLLSLITATHFITDSLILLFTSYNFFKTLWPDLLFLQSNVGTTFHPHSRICTGYLLNKELSSKLLHSPTNHFITISLIILLNCLFLMSHLALFALLLRIFCLFHLSNLLLAGALLLRCSYYLEQTAHLTSLFPFN